MTLIPGTMVMGQLLGGQAQEELEGNRIR